MVVDCVIVGEMDLDFGNGAELFFKILQKLRRYILTLAMRP